MNILFQTGSYPPKGGTDFFVATISKKLAERGHNVSVLSHKLKNEKFIDHKENGVNIYYTQSIPRKRFFIPFYFLRFLVLFYKANKIVSKEKIDTIVLNEHEMLPFVPFKLKGVKIILRGGGLFLVSINRYMKDEIGDNIYTKFVYKISQLYHYFVSLFPDAIAPVNESEKDYFNIYNKRHVKVIPHGVDTDLFKPLKKKKKNNKIIIGCVGRLCKIKFPEDNLRIFSEISKKTGKKLEFWWIGPLDKAFPKDFWNNLVKKYHLEGKAKWLGEIKNKDLPKYLGKMDIFSNIENQSNVSRVNAEAASCGLPVLDLNTGKEKYGFFTSLEQDFKKELLKLVEDDKYRKVMGKKAREVVIKEYSDNAMASKYEDFIKEIQK